MISDPYEEERFLSFRAHLLWMYGRMNDLTSVGLNVFGLTGLNKEGWVEYQNLLDTGFKPNRDRLIDCLSITGHILPSHIEYAADMMLDFDWLMQEISEDSKDN